MDTADPRRRQNHRFGTLIAEKPTHRRLVGKVELLMRPAQQISMTALLKRAHHGRTHQSAMAGHIYSRLFGYLH
jgi:hypothetical protein